MLSPDATASLRVEIIGRRVYRRPDMYRWERTEAMADVAAFVGRMNSVAKRNFAVPGRKRWSDKVNEVMRVLQNVCGWAEEHKPTKDDLMVGSCFRKFHGLLHADGYDLLIRSYGRWGDHRAVELPVYLERSFGDPDNMTYGLEHELSFCMFLMALFNLCHLKRADEPYIVAVVFNRYSDIVNDLIKSYRLEPSTVFGNWGLNDYRFVGFLWGSAQISARSELRKRLSPAAAVLEPEAARRHRDECLFAKCMDAVHREADGPTVAMAEEEGVEPRRRRPVWLYAYQLWNLSALSSWDRVNDCLAAAFPRDVLGRFEVVRHLVFGELLRFTRNRRSAGEVFDDCEPATRDVLASESLTTSNTDRPGGYRSAADLELFGTESFEVFDNFE